MLTKTTLGGVRVDLSTGKVLDGSKLGHGRHDNLPHEIVLLEIIFSRLFRRSLLFFIAYIHIHP
jgi:hypothetical protein